MEAEKPLLEWSVATRTMSGEIECGDAHLVVELPGGALVAVVDGLGHGREAAVAAREAVATLTQHADEPVVPLLQRCHGQLRATRGVVMTLASFRAADATMTWLGVGNVEGFLLRANAAAIPARESVLLRGGVVGYEIPPLRPATHRVAAGDTLVLATDGIRSAFAEGLDVAAPPREMAAGILARHAKDTDDALVLVARWLGIAA
ncbi:MAG: stage II sporulation protein E (SpoIIE) [Deltaproteobacteria bacterium]|nr:MAG: stage II sporulation protein E (SpoIIE) [Deltaproteobacteria bacterium]